MSLRRVSLTQSLHNGRAAARPATLAASGRYDRRAIMARAVMVARGLHRSGRTWARAMAVGLRSAWQAARTALATDTARRPLSPVLEPRRASPAIIARPGFIRGSRIFSHGW